MENREKNRTSQRTQHTETGDVHRRTGEEQGRERKSGTGAELGQKIGRADLDENEEE